MSYNAAQLRERALARQREDEDRVRNLQKHVTKMAAMGAANNRCVPFSSRLLPPA